MCITYQYFLVSLHVFNGNVTDRSHFPASGTVRCGHMTGFWPMECEQEWQGTTSMSIKTSQTQPSLFCYPFSCCMERTLKTKKRVELQDGKSSGLWMITQSRDPSPLCPPSFSPSFLSLFLLSHFFLSLFLSSQPLHQLTLNCKQEK